jgi:hypothetical protein
MKEEELFVVFVRFQERQTLESKWEGEEDQTKSGTLLGLRRRATAKWVEGEMDEPVRSGGASDLVNRSVHEWFLDCRR